MPTIHSIRRTTYATITGLTPNTFQPLSILLELDGRGQEIFNGQLYANASSVNVQVDDIARDYAWAFSFDSNNRPTNELSSATAMCEYIEKSKFIVTTLDYPSGNMKVSATRDDVDWTISVPAGLYSKPLLRIPAMATNNYWFTNTLFSSNTTVHYNIGGISVTPFLIGSGSFNYCCSLDKLFKTLPTATDISFETTTRTKIGTVDLCPARYYVLWMDKNCQMNSYGFEGTPQVDYASTLVELKGPNDDRVVNNNMTKRTFNLTTDYIDNSTFSQLCTMVESPFTYVFDTTTDTGYLCVPPTSSSTSKSKMSTFNVSLQESKYYSL